MKTKQVFLSSAAILSLSISIAIFQLSCKKEASAQNSSSGYTLPVATTNTLGGIMVDGSSIKVDANGKISATMASAASSIIIYVKQNSNGED